MRKITKTNIEEFAKEIISFLEKNCLASATSIYFNNKVMRCRDEWEEDNYRVCWTVTENVNPHDYFEYCAFDHILSMSFEGPLYDVLNETFGRQEEEFRAIFDKYGVYYIQKRSNWAKEKKQDLSDFVEPEVFAFNYEEYEKYGTIIGNMQNIATMCKGREDLARELERQTVREVAEQYHAVIGKITTEEVDEQRIREEMKNYGRRDIDIEKNQMSIEDFVDLDDDEEIPFD